MSDLKSPIMTSENSNNSGIRYRTPPVLKKDVFIIVDSGADTDSVGERTSPSSRRRPRRCLKKVLPRWGHGVLSIKFLAILFAVLVLLNISWPYLTELYGSWATTEESDVVTTMATTYPTMATITNPTDTDPAVDATRTTGLTTPATTTTAAESEDFEMESSEEEEDEPERLPLPDFELRFDEASQPELSSANFSLSRALDAEQLHMEITRKEAAAGLTTGAFRCLTPSERSLVLERRRLERTRAALENTISELWGISMALDLAPLLRTGTKEEKRRAVEVWMRTVLPRTVPVAVTDAALAESIAVGENIRTASFADAEALEAEMDRQANLLYNMILSIDRQREENTQSLAYEYVLQRRLFRQRAEPICKPMKRKDGSLAPAIRPLDPMCPCLAIDLWGYIVKVDKNVHQRT